MKGITMTTLIIIGLIFVGLIVLTAGGILWVACWIAKGEPDTNGDPERDSIRDQRCVKSCCSVSFLSECGRPVRSNVTRPESVIFTDPRIDERRIVSLNNN